jgi:rRNA maturation RNase YbeY
MIFPDQSSAEDSITFNYLNEDFPKVHESAMAMIHQIIKEENKSLNQLTFVFCDDSYLLNLNQQFLKHDTLTDIITFPMSSDGIDGEIYISIPRVRENAGAFSNSFTSEYLRVIAHGVLHLCGYKDKSEEEIRVMRAKEDHYIAFALNQ